MICEECKLQGLKSNVYEGLSTKTLLYCTPYYDEDGKYHMHDSNITITKYTCSNKHEFVHKYKPVWICCEKKETE